MYSSTIASGLFFVFDQPRYSTRSPTCTSLPLTLRFEWLQFRTHCVDMKAGDVVNFNAKSWVFNSANDRYTNPGIIIEQIAEHLSEVYWRDGKITREHSSYLVKVTSASR